jgi:hypothetical protein
MPAVLASKVVFVYDTARRVGPPGTPLYHGIVRARNDQGIPTKKVLWECDHTHLNQGSARACSFAKCKANAHRWRWYL